MDEEQFFICKNCGTEFPSTEVRLYCKVCKSNLDKSNINVEADLQFVGGI